jgi:predicted unusual protein kinase regulating ubiquinone biosynthesis (AarF/ABC1/UbiB family)
VARVAIDIQQGREKERRSLRAQELQEIIAKLGPAIIKGGQALASRCCCL